MRAFFDLGISPTLPNDDPAVEFGEWLPDLPVKDNPGATEALNVIPSENSYRPFGAHLASGSAMAAAVRGAMAVYTDDTRLNVYAGVFNGIYAKQTNWTQLYTSPISLADGLNWQFLQYGVNVVAIHAQIPPVKAKVGGATPFTPLGGNPPTAACGARVRDFLVLGNLIHDPDSATSDPYPSRIRWSGFNNIEQPWVSDVATQADYQDMPTEGGPVMAITGRETGTIFQSRTVSRMRYVGIPTIFEIETVEERRGAIAPGCVVDLGLFVFYIAEDGFYVWNGTNSTPIGDNKINKYFFNRLNYAAKNRIQSAVDFNNKCIIWAFPTDQSYNLSELIIYSWKENRFTHALITLETIFSSGLPNFNLDTLTGNLDTDYSTSFDDLTYNGGGHSILAAFNTSHQYGFFNGGNLAATIETGEFSGPNGRRVDISNTRPLVDLSSRVATVQVGTRDQIFGDALAYGTAVAQELDGTCPVLSDARLVRLRLNIPSSATWTAAQGIEVWRRPGGRV